MRPNVIRHYIIAKERKLGQRFCFGFACNYVASIGLAFVTAVVLPLFLRPVIFRASNKMPLPLLSSLPY